MRGRGVVERILARGGKHDAGATEGKEQACIFGLASRLTVRAALHAGVRPRGHSLHTYNAHIDKHAPSYRSSRTRATLSSVAARRVGAGTRCGGSDFGVRKG